MIMLCVFYCCLVDFQGRNPGGLIPVNMDPRYGPEECQVNIFTAKL